MRFLCERRGVAFLQTPPEVIVEPLRTVIVHFSHVVVEALLQNFDGLFYGAYIISISGSWPPQFAIYRQTVLFYDSRARFKNSRRRKHRAGAKSAEKPARVTGIFLSGIPRARQSAPSLQLRAQAFLEDRNKLPA